MRRTEPTTFRKLSLPVAVLAPVEAILFDPARGKPTYGSLSAFISNLMRDWLKANGITTMADAERLRLVLRQRLSLPPPSTTTTESL